MECSRSTSAGYASLLERDRVLLADFDVAVTGIASQPFWLSGLDEGVQRWHAPDYLLACADGSVIVVDAKPARMCQEPVVAAVFEWTGRLCRSRGWRYEVFHGGDAVVMANLRFVAQGRRSMFLDEECVTVVSAAGRSGMTLGQIEGRGVGVRSTGREGFGPSAALAAGVDGRPDSALVESFGGLRAGEG